MTGTVNPLLHQVLHRRRLRRRARLSAASWVVLGGMHIAVWWAAFGHVQTVLPQAVLDAAVWPLLLAATAAFVMMVYFTARWFLAPGDPTTFDWLESVSGTEDTAEPSAVPQLAS